MLEQAIWAIGPEAMTALVIVAGIIGVAVLPWRDKDLQETEEAVAYAREIYRKWRGR